MGTYNSKLVQVVWRGETLSGFAHNQIQISQSSEPSMKMVIGIFEEYFNCINPKRTWEITSSFLVNSESYKNLEKDNLRRNRGTLIVRDLNLGTCDIFHNCFISSIGDKKDADARTVTWQAAKRNFM